jgi:hypothetical protein
MFKVSFSKKYVENPVKTEVFNNNITKVTLTGYISEIGENELLYNKRAGVLLSKEESSALIFKNGEIIATGTSKKSSNDEYDEVLGYRIAESRAKIKIYKTMCKFTKKYFNYLRLYCYGDTSVTPNWIMPGSLLSTILKYNALLKEEQKHLNTLIHGTDTKSPQ